MVSPKYTCPCPSYAWRLIRQGLNAGDFSVCFWEIQAQFHFVRIRMAKSNWNYVEMDNRDMKVIGFVICTNFSYYTSENRRKSFALVATIPTTVIQTDSQLQCIARRHHRWNKPHSISAKWMRQSRIEQKLWTFQIKVSSWLHIRWVSLAPVSDPCEWNSCWPCGMHWWRWRWCWAMFGVIFTSKLHFGCHFKRLCEELDQFSFTWKCF